MLGFIVFRKKFFIGFKEGKLGMVMIWNYWLFFSCFFLSWIYWGNEFILLKGLNFISFIILVNEISFKYKDNENCYIEVFRDLY